MSKMFWIKKVVRELVCSFFPLPLFFFFFPLPFFLLSEIKNLFVGVQHSASKLLGLSRIGSKFDDGGSPKAAKKEKKKEKIQVFICSMIYFLSLF